MIRFRRTFINAEQLPVVWEITGGGGASVDEACAWLGDQRPAIEAVLEAEGALLIRGLSELRTAAHFQLAIDVLAPELMDYVGGTSPRRVVQGRIMTATESPPPYSIPLHQEMTYTDNPPERIAFFCQAPAAGGGQTTVGDMRRITRLIDPAVRERWRACGVQLRRTLPRRGAVRRKPGVAKSWSEVFGTDDRGEVERIAAERGWKLAWLEDGGSMHLWQEVRPAMKVHAGTGDEIWFNQAHLYAPAVWVVWARHDGRYGELTRIEKALAEQPDLLDQVFHGTGEPIDDREVIHVYETLRAAAVPVDWQRSDLLLLENTPVAHGRAPFQGERSVLAALIRDRRQAPA